MAADADHEVIESPEALFRHLYEAHRVDEARDLDADTAPVHFWLRRHEELERADRLRAARAAMADAAAEGAPAAPGAAPRPPPGDHTGPPAAAGRPGHGPDPTGPARRDDGGRRAAVSFGDPLVEAVARALIGRGHDERRVRAAIRAWPAGGGHAGGEAGVRAALVEPMLRAAADRLLGRDGAARPEAHRPPPARPVADQAPREVTDRAAPGAASAQAPWETGAWPPPRGRRRGRPATVAAAERPPPPTAPPSPAADDLWALADALQRGRGRAAQRT